MPGRNPELKKDKVLSSKAIYEGRILSLRVDTVETADGQQSTREIVARTDCIGVVPVDADDNIIMVKQYRLATGKELLEIPAGGIDPGEDAVVAVTREMQEETGLRPQRVERLTGFYLSPGFCSEYLHLYLAADLMPDPLSAEDTAGIEVVRVPVAQVTGLIASGQIEDAKSIAGLLMYLERRRVRKN
jgi:ADP-ribose pyrophosphatase